MKNFRCLTPMLWLFTFIFQDYIINVISRQESLCFFYRSFSSALSFLVVLHRVRPWNLSIYRPDGSCAYTYTYNNSDNNWIGQKLDRTGVWKIQSRISGSLVGTNTQTINVKDTNRSTYNDVFASVKGRGYSLNQARESASSTFRKGEFVYVWGYLHDAANNLYKSYGSGTCNLTLSIYRPDGSCAHTYTYNNSDNNWIGRKLDMSGVWKLSLIHI